MENMVNYKTSFSPNKNFGVWNMTPNELHIIGDIHGDFFALKQSLELTNCVKFEDYKHELIYNKDTNTYYLEDGCSIYQNKEIIWNPEKINCVIVFSGDIIDRCRSVNNSCVNTINDENCDYLILKLLFNLDKKALKYNSRVVLVLGNHEIMNFKNINNYVSNKGKNDKDRNKNINKLILENINNVYGMVKIDNTIIVHGGINDEYIKKFKKIFENYKEEYEYICLFNKYLQMYLKNLLVDSAFDKKVMYFLNKKVITDDNYKTYEIFYNLFIIDIKISPFWDRTLGGIGELNEDQCKNTFDNNILNIKTPIDKLKIIVGHCPQFMQNHNINLVDCQNYKDKIYRIDVGMSRAFDNYAKYDVLNEFLDSINLNNCKYFNFNMFYDYYFNNFRQVCVLQILPNSVYNKIKGNTSIEYFNGYFKDCKDLLLYTLSDIYIIYTKIPDPKDIKTKIQNILKSSNRFSLTNLINKIFNFLIK